MLVSSTGEKEYKNRQLTTNTSYVIPKEVITVLHPATDLFKPVPLSLLAFSSSDTPVAFEARGEGCLAGKMKRTVGGGEPVSIQQVSQPAYLRASPRR